MGIKISELTELGSPNSAALLPIVQDGETRKVQLGALFGANPLTFGGPMYPLGNSGAACNAPFAALGTNAIQLDLNDDTPEITCVFRPGSMAIYLLDLVQDEVGGRTPTILNQAGGPVVFIPPVDFSLEPGDHNLLIIYGEPSATAPSFVTMANGFEEPPASYGFSYYGEEDMLWGWQDPETGGRLSYDRDDDAWQTETSYGAGFGVNGSGDYGWMEMAGGLSMSLNGITDSFLVEAVGGETIFADGIEHRVGLSDNPDTFGLNRVEVIGGDIGEVYIRNEAGAYFDIWNDGGAFGQIGVLLGPTITVGGAGDYVQAETAAGGYLGIDGGTDDSVYAGSAAGISLLMHGINNEISLATNAFEFELSMRGASGIAELLANGDPFLQYDIGSDYLFLSSVAGAYAGVDGANDTITHQTDDGAAIKVFGSGSDYITALTNGGAGFSAYGIDDLLSMMSDGGAGVEVDGDNDLIQVVTNGTDMGVLFDGPNKLTRFAHDNDGSEFWGSGMYFDLDFDADEFLLQTSGNGAIRLSGDTNVVYFENLDHIDLTDGGGIPVLFTGSWFYRADDVYNQINPLPSIVELDIEIAADAAEATYAEFTISQGGMGFFTTTGIAKYGIEITMRDTTHDSLNVYIVQATLILLMIGQDGPVQNTTVVLNANDTGFPIHVGLPDMTHEVEHFVDGDLQKIRVNITGATGKAARGDIRIYAKSNFLPLTDPA